MRDKPTGNLRRAKPISLDRSRSADDDSRVRVRRRQFLAAAGGLLLAKGRLVADAGSATTRPQLPPEIAERCDSLMSRAIRSPYGWGWHDENPGIDLTRTRPKGKPPEIDATLTARAALLLHLVAEASGQAKHSAAAIEAARGVLAVQTRTGQIRATGVMGAFGGLKDDATDVPDRRPTCAALAAVLTILAALPTPDMRLRGPAQRCAHWLIGQQTRGGGWPDIFPSDAPRGQGTKLLVLNQTGHRDTALTILLAAEVLVGDDGRGITTPDRQMHLSFARAAEILTFSRISAGLPPKRALWPTICKLDSDSNTRQNGVPVCVDLLSSRYALEVFLPGYLVQQTAEFGDALKGARDALLALKRDQKRWHRRYDLGLKPILPPVADPGGVFSPLPPSEKSEPPTATAELLAVMQGVLERGAKRSYDSWQAQMPMVRRLALVVVRFSPDAMLHESNPPAGTAPDDPGLAGFIQSTWKGLSTFR